MILREHLFIYLLFLYPPADGEKKLKLTTLPRIFIRVVCRYNKSDYERN